MNHASDPKARNPTSTRAAAAPVSCSVTGSPAPRGPLRPWAQYLAEAGLTVSVPRLPGHGTTWQEMSRTRWEDWYAEADRGYEELRGQSNEIFVMGLSMGGCLALRMAEQRGAGVSGLVLVKPVAGRRYEAVHAGAGAQAGGSVAARDRQ